MADERLLSWAQERVPGLLRQAEEEALAEVRGLLRDALVQAATAGSPAPEPPAPPPRPAAPRPAAPAGEAQWLYAVSRSATAAAAESQTGVRGSRVEVVEDGALAALVSTVPLAEFGEEELKQNLNDLGWLEEVARTHERVVDAAFEEGPVVPLRLCTIYATTERVRELLREEGERFAELLDGIDGKQEWSVKLFADPSLLGRSPDPAGEGTEPQEGLGSGGAYLARRRADRTAREAADRLAGELAEEVHARLQDWAADAVVGRPQNPELSGHSGEMLLNGSYLVEQDGAERFAALVTELQKRYEEVGATLELSGPWPPYNFISADP